MNLLKFLGFGVLIWDVIFITDSVLNTLKISSTLIMQIVFMVAIIITYLLTENLDLDSVSGAIKYGFAWAIVMMLLDAAVAACYLGWESFSQFDTWINYVLVVLVPIFTIKLKDNQKIADAS